MQGKRVPLRSCLVMLSLLLPSLAWGETAQEVAKRVAPSVVLLVMNDANGQPTAMGSGFVVREGVVATNLHVVTGASGGYAKLAGEKTKFEIAGTVGIDTARDLALLSVKGMKAPALQMGDSKKVEVGETVYAVGNPRGLEGTFSAGIVSSVRKIGEDYLLQITAPISPGSSGGPVVNSKGEVVGVSVATFKGGQNLNFAIPSSYLSTLASGPATLTPLAPAGVKGKKSILEDLGGPSTEGVEGGVAFTWEASSHTGYFSFSLRNKLRSSVKNVYCLLVFYDAKGTAIDVYVVKYPGIIPAGLAKRVTGKVDGSVGKLNTPDFDKLEPTGRIEFRILYFDLLEGDGADEE